MEWLHDKEKLFEKDDGYQCLMNAHICPHMLSISCLGRYYKDGAENLINAVFENRSALDILIYPIVFLYRQYLELIIKDLISTARQLEEKGDSFPYTHNLKDLWAEAEELIESHYKDKSPKQLKYVQNCIDDFHKYDPESFAFRYLKDKKGNYCLEQLKYMNLLTFHETMTRLSNFLDCINADLSQRLQACHDSY